MNVDLGNYELKTQEVYKKLCFNFTKHFFLWGSRKSGKTWFVVDFAMLSCVLFPKLRVLLLRCFTEGMRKTTFANYKESINRLGISALVKVNNETKIKFINGSTIEYTGMLGKEATLKDSEYDLYIYEEAEQSLRTHYTALVNTIRAGQSGVKKSLCGSMEFKKKLVLVMNPPTETDHYTVKMFQNQDEFPNIEFLKTTIDDNEFATEEDYAELEAIKIFDEHDYRRLRFGEIALRTEGLFFLENKNYFFVSEKQFAYMTDREFRKKKLESNIKKYKLTNNQQLYYEKSINKKKYLINVNGGDFSSGVGRDPLVLLDIFIDLRKRLVFVKDIIFDNSLSDPQDIYKEMKKKGVKKTVYQFWDSQNGLMVQAIKNQGYKAENAQKTLILDGINKLKEFKIFICASDRYITRSLIKQKTKQDPLKMQIPKYSRIYDAKLDGFRSKPEEDKSNMGIDFWDSLRYGVISYMLKFGKK
jgi:PBSX family phage terminase large subunit